MVYQFHLSVINSINIDTIRRIIQKSFIVLLFYIYELKLIR